MKELREFVEMMDAIEAGKPIQEEAVDLAQISDMLDELDETLRHAVGLANNLARYGREVPGPFAGQIRSYLEPHLESWLSDRRQPGSIPSLRSILNDRDEDDLYESQTFDHLSSKRLKSILLAPQADARTLEWAMDFTEDALRADYDDEMIDSRTFDARNNAFKQASEAFYDEDGEINDRGDLNKTLMHLKQFWSV